MFISGGENVYPAEVENAYTEHPAVLESAVIGVSDKKWGEVGKAYVLLREGKTVSPEDLSLLGAHSLPLIKFQNLLSSLRSSPGPPQAKFKTPPSIKVK